MPPLSEVSDFGLFMFSPVFNGGKHAAQTQTKFGKNIALYELETITVRKMY